MNSVVAALRVVAQEGKNREDPTAGPLIKLAVHHLLWGITAYALAHDRIEVFPVLAELTPQRQYGKSLSVFEERDLRHADAFDRSAGQTYESGCEWLRTFPLRAEMPRWRRDEDLDATLGEAELLAAMRFARRWGDGTYCHIVGRVGGATRRLREHLAMADGRQQLAGAFSVSPAELTETLSTLYGRLRGPDRFPPAEPLLPE